MFFLILNGFYLIWPFNSQKNSIVSYRSWKNFYLQFGAKGIERSEFCADFKNVWTLASISSQRFFSQINVFFAKVLKNQFFCKFFPLLLNSRIQHIFEISAKFPLLLIPFADYFEEFFSKSYKGRCYFFSEDKRSNNVETVQYFKEPFFMN